MGTISQSEDDKAAILRHQMRLWRATRAPDGQSLLPSAWTMCRPTPTKVARLPRGTVSIQPPDPATWLLPGWEMFARFRAEWGIPSAQVSIVCHDNAAYFVVHERLIRRVLRRAGHDVP